MNLYEEIAKVAYELYEKSGCIQGRDVENWANAERIVLARHASQDIEEPEGEEPLILDEGLIEEIEEQEPRYAVRKAAKEPTVLEEIKVKEPALGTREDMAVKTEKIKPAKKIASQEKKNASKKTNKKSGKTATKKAGQDLKIT